MLTLVWFNVPYYPQPGIMGLPYPDIPNLGDTWLGCSKGEKTMWDNMSLVLGTKRILELTTFL